MHKDPGPMIILLRSLGTPMCYIRLASAVNGGGSERPGNRRSQTETVGFWAADGRWVLVPRPASQGGDGTVKQRTACSSYVSEVMS